MAKFLYVKFKDQMEEQDRANSDIPGQSERTNSVLSYNAGKKQ